MTLGLKFSQIITFKTQNYREGNAVPNREFPCKYVNWNSVESKCPSPEKNLKGHVPLDV